MFRCGASGILCVLMLLAGRSVAQVEVVQLNAVPAPYPNTVLAASDGFLAVADAGEVRVYQVEIDGDLVPIGVINERNTVQMVFCNSFLVVCTEINGTECGLAVYDVPGLTELSRHDSDGIFHYWVTACGNRLYIKYFFTGLNIFTIGDAGQIVLEAIHEGLPIPIEGFPSCNHELLSVVEPFDNFGVLDITDPQNPVPVYGFEVFEDLFGIGLSEDGVFVSGMDHGPLVEGIRMLRRSEGGFEVVSFASGSVDYQGMVTDGHKVMARSRPWPLFHDRLSLFHVSYGASIRLQAVMDFSGDIGRFVLDDPFVFVHDLASQQLRIYGIITPPTLVCQVRPDLSLLLSWREVPEAVAYRVYTRSSLDGERRLLLETMESRVVIPRQSGMHFFDVVFIR